MCGRYYRKSDKQKIAEAHRGTTTSPPPPCSPSSARAATPASANWSRCAGGLIPFFTQSLSDVKGISTINVRAETITTSGTYREPFKRRRCIVPASGFYEWKKLNANIKQPFAFDLANGKMMAFAGLWDTWKDPANGQWLQSYTIITTDANELMAPVHDRMPVILHPGDFNRWLDREVTDQPPIDLLRPFPADEMEAFEVSKDVGNVKNNSPELLNSK
jgi:putative SOS response-associated peptidase YedK